jgi:hypothetical protein
MKAMKLQSGQSVSPAKIRNGHLLNKSQEYYHLTLTSPVSILPDADFTILTCLQEAGCGRIPVNKCAVRILTSSDNNNLHIVNYLLQLMLIK